MAEKIAVVVAVLVLIVPLAAFMASHWPFARRVLFCLCVALPGFFSLPFVECSLVWDATYRGSSRGISLSLLDMASLTLAIALCVVRRRVTWWPRGSWLLLACFVWPAGTAVISENPQFAVFELFNLLRAYAVFWMLANYFEEFGDLRTFLGTLAGVVVIQASVACHQHLSGQFRATGLLGDPNLAGMYLNLLLPILFAVGLETRGWWRWLCLVPCGLGALAVLITYSRGSWLMLAGSLLLVSTALLVIRPQPQKLAILGPAALAALLLLSIKSDSLLSRWGGGLAELRDADSSARGLGPAFAMISDFPVTGVGLNHISFMLNERHYGEAVKIGERGVIHNLYLTTAAETGIAGVALLLAAFLWLFATGVRTAWQCRQSPVALALAVGISTSVLVLAIHSWTEWVTRCIVILQTLAIIAALLLSLSRGHRQAAIARVAQRRSLEL